MVAPLSINHAQEVILKKTMNACTTVVTGPPGTGKSQVVVDLVANAWTHGQSILVTSTNNAAVDVAVSRANSVVSGLVIRTGNKTAREAVPDVVAQLVSGAKGAQPHRNSVRRSQPLSSDEGTRHVLLQLKRSAELENLHQEQLQEKEKLEEAVRDFGPIEVADINLVEVQRRAKEFSREKVPSKVPLEEICQEKRSKPRSGVHRPHRGVADVETRKLESGKRNLGASQPGWRRGQAL